MNSEQKAAKEILEKESNNNDKSSITIGIIFLIAIFVFPIIYFFEHDNIIIVSTIFFSLYSIIFFAFIGLGLLLNMIKSLKKDLESEKFFRNKDIGRLCTNYMFLSVYFFGIFDFTNEKVQKIVSNEILNLMEDITKNPGENNKRATEFVENNNSFVIDIIEKVNKKLEKKEPNDDNNHENSKNNMD